MIITRQVIGCVFEPLSQQKKLKQKLIFHFPAAQLFAFFLEHSSFNQSSLRQTVCDSNNLFSTHAPLWSLHTARSRLEPKLLTKSSH